MHQEIMMEKDIQQVPLTPTAPPGVGDIAQLQEHLVRLEMHMTEVKDSLEKLQLQRDIEESRRLNRFELAGLVLQVVEFLGKLL